MGLEAWRWMFIVMAVPAVVYGSLAFTIPESPRYLVATFRIPEARRVLTTLLGEKNLELTISRIQESLKSEKPPSWRDLRKPTGGLYGIVWVGVLLSVFQQFVGIKNPQQFRIVTGLTSLLGAVTSNAGNFHQRASEPSYPPSLRSSSTSATKTPSRTTPLRASSANEGLPCATGRRPPRDVRRELAEPHHCRGAGHLPGRMVA